ncbi:MAG: plasmid stabilization protein [Rhodospirillaceae bacterium]|nr:MAG: plasmid stabilization protein [Rhodospirillaceae bacterium]
MARYDLSEAAALDFENIFDYGIDTFGLKQALKYQNKLKERFEMLAEQPEQYPAIDDICSGFRRSVFGAHSIYYRVESSSVLIVRILGQQNPDDAF